MAKRCGATEKQVIQRSSARADAAAAEESDGDLLRAHSAGDPFAFTRLFDRHAERLRSICSRYLRDPWIAEDVVQDVFLRLLEEPRATEADFNVGAWLRRVAINRCVDELRRSRHQRSLPADEAIDTARETPPPPDPFEGAATRELVVEVLGLLPERERRILIEHHAHGMSYAAIARAESMTAAAVHGVLHRGGRHFKQLYAMASRRFSADAPPRSPHR